MKFSSLINCDQLSINCEYCDENSKESKKIKFKGVLRCISIGLHSVGRPVAAITTTNTTTSRNKKSI